MKSQVAAPVLFFYQTKEIGFRELLRSDLFLWHDLSARLAFVELNRSRYLDLLAFEAGER
jgi:hypothetical protein